MREKSPCAKDFAKQMQKHCKMIDHAEALLKTERAKAGKAAGKVSSWEVWWRNACDNLPRQVTNKVDRAGRKRRAPPADGCWGGGQ